MTRTGEYIYQGPVPQWEAQARDRLAAAIDHFSSPLADLLERDANEGDTRFLVTDFLSDGLGYDKYGSLTTEYRTKGESVDYGIRIGGDVFAFIEVKACRQSLDARNLRQAKLHAVDESVEWVVLTNGRTWQVHHCPPDAETGTDLVLDVDLLAEGGREFAVSALFHLTQEAVEHGRLEDLRKWRAALSPEPLVEILRSGAVIDAVRHEMRRRTGHLGHLGDTEEILRALNEGVISRRVTS
ncbi:MAG: hypothetical protein M0026_13010 [Nocardiopsaceae bacterium]|nr:hypothetical protein [Nocardiopsaceae bacterium]